MNQNTAVKYSFSQYEIFVIVIMTLLQFSVVLDFMVLSPLGTILMKELSIEPSQFALVVSAYAISAGISGLAAAGFTDKFDRKTLLLFFYIGFIAGTAFCALAPTYEYLLAARIVTGIFGGVISSISFAIVTDLFKMEVRGRVMGFLQMAFAASQVLGIPIGFKLAEKLGWHSTFWMIVAVSIPVCIAIVLYLKPLVEHLKYKSDKHPIKHLIHTASQPEYLRGFMTTTLLATGGFMLMPFGSDFSTNNLKIPIDDIFLLFFITGIFSFIAGPIAGKLSDSIGKFKVFVAGSLIGFILVGIYTNMGPTPFWLVSAMNVVLFIGITTRIISSSALMTAVPEPQDRGAFMSINSSVQQISGGIASAIAGMIVVKAPDGALQNYGILGFVVMGTIIITVVSMYFLNKQIQSKLKPNS